MTPIVLISQRLALISPHGEIREELDIEWGHFFQKCGFIHLPASYLVAPEKYFSNFKINGLVLSGGNDLGCVNQGDKLSHLRDKYERELITLALNHKIPIIGVCRGMQMLSHYFGGKLIKCERHAGTRHPISIAENTELSAFYSKAFEVNSFHQYAVESAGDGLAVAALSPEDRSIEAIEHKSKKVLGIMWHPERSQPFRSEDIQLFQSVFKPIEAKLS